MKQSFVWVFSLALFVVAPPLMAETRTEIMTALDYYAEVWNEGDVDALRGYYHQDFVLVNDDGAVTMGQQIDDIKSIGESGGDRGELSMSNVTVKELGDDHAVAYGGLSLDFKDGSSINTWFSTVYVKTPFGWKAILTRN